MSLTLIGLFITFLGFYFLLSQLKKHKKSFNYRVLTALIGGLVFGSLIQLTLGNHSVVAREFSELISIFCTNIGQNVCWKGELSPIKI